MLYVQIKNTKRRDENKNNQKKKVFYSVRFRQISMMISETV